VRLLLDTHILLWALANDRRLSAGVRTVIEDSAQAYVSVASVWEIAIKRASGKLDAPADLGRVITYSGFDPLPIGVDHALSAGSLPPHHADPFDRMLVAQAQHEGLTLVTADRQIAKYDVRVLVA